MYTQNCNCFCGCEEVLESFVPLRGHIECQRCFDGLCISDHYEKTRRLCSAPFEDTTCTRIEGMPGTIKTRLRPSASASRKSFGQARKR
jgi:hypothetical protein